PVVAGPLKLMERDASEAVVVRTPVYRTDQHSGGKHFIGAVGTPFLFDSLLREAGLPDIEQTLHVAIRGRDGKGSSGEVFYGNPEVFTMNPVMQKVSLPGGEWEIAAYPRSGWGAISQTVYAIRLLGFAAGLLAASWAYGLARHLQLRTENERRLRKSEAQLKLRDSALNVAANAMVITDRDARVVWANQAFTKLTGYGLDEAVGHHCQDMAKSGRHDPQFYEEMWQTILSGKVWHGELTNQHKDGKLYHDEMTITPVCGENGEITHFVLLKQDITVRKANEEQLKNLAFHDPLTQLPNRRLLIDRLRQTLVASKRSGRYGAVMFLDLDNFKPLNDQHGHDVGDVLLVKAAQRIVSCVREEDTVARFGGDEFVVMLKDLDADKAVSATLANGVAEKIRAALAEPYQLELLQAENGKSVIEHHCTSSIGVVLFAGQEAAEEDIIKWADIAMYHAKTAGRNAIRFYDPGGVIYSQFPLSLADR
ncbi:MAG TPA: diguanylate cyclase, partial [Gallionella sp.]|nr:diguanylate cyclase [Gallionella sp.]